MPTHKKGHDKDKYYHLAKDQGYRSRAAFKLIQINKRFDFLSKSRVLIDLCGAPGGWSQVAAKCMPIGSLVLAVDLLPIKPIRNVKTIVSDITTAECRKMVVAELSGWKADVVLCDGAPNIGAAYSKDAYVQNELVLAALKTATDHLVLGGTFVTKVYRSTDYNAIVWVLQQLFEDVQTMKPNSSRSQSSEIFLVCLKYTNPSRIDPKLLDPNHVFKEVEDPGLKKVDIFHKKFDKSNKRQRSGYDESLGMLLKKTASISEFISSNDPIQLLTDTAELVFTEECRVYKEHPKTTPEIVASCVDLRVLGKVDFKKLLKWRLLLKESEENVATKDMVMNDENEDKAVKVMVKTDDMLQNEINDMFMKTIQENKKIKKKSRKELMKERQRQLLGITNNAFDTAEDIELFTTNNNDNNEVNLSDDEAADMFYDDNHDNNQENDRKLIFIEDDLDDQLEQDYIRFHDNEVDEMDETGEKTQIIPPSMIDKWFSHPIFNSRIITKDDKQNNNKENRIKSDKNQKKNEQNNNNEEEELIMPKTDREIRKLKRQKDTDRRTMRTEKKAKALDKDIEAFTIAYGGGNDNSNNDNKGTHPVEEEKEGSSNKIHHDYLSLPNKLGDGSREKRNDDEVGFEIVPKDSILDEFKVHDTRSYDSDHEDYDAHDRLSTIALGTMMLRQSKKKALVDASYNRYAWNDSKDMPSWFLDDELRHNKPQLPIPKALLDQIKSRYQSVGTKEIKKVAEARMRKRKRALTKLKAAKKQATVMADNSEMSEKQKVKAIEKAMRTKKIDKPSKVYVVTRKTKVGSVGTAASSGSKGKLKFVDKRMKKDARAMKNLNKKKKSKH
eukprot:gene8579-11592_t